MKTVNVEQVNKIYEFGGFRLMVAERLFGSDSTTIALPPKVFDTLVLLVESGGRTLSKDELIGKLWPESFVEESNLTHYISHLRKVLGDSSSEPKFIETVPKHGYRFIAPVKAVTSETITPITPITPILPAASVAVPAQAPAVQPSNRRLMAAMAAIVIVSAAGIVSLLITGSRDRAPFQKIAISRLTTNARVARAAISADGKYIVYAQQEGERASLWVRQTNSTSSLQILAAEPRQIIGVTISADSTRVYYVARAQQQSALFELPLLGGTPRKLLEAVDSPVTCSPDGKQIAFVRALDAQRAHALMIYNADGTGGRELARFAGAQQLSLDGPAWSPDGKVIAAVIGALNFGAANMRVAAIDLQSGSVQTIGQEHWSWAGQVAWTADGGGLVLPAWQQESPHFTDQLWYLSYPQGARRKITSDISKYSGAALSRTGQLLTIQSKRHSRLNVTLTGAARNEVNFGFGDNFSEMFGIAWTADGRIVYGSNAGGNGVDLWIMNGDGSAPRQLTFDAAADLAPTVAGDGRYIFFCSFRGGSPHIWRMEADGSNAVQLTNGGGETAPSASADGRWIYYIALTSGRRTLWRMNVDGSDARQLTDYEAFRPAVSPDGSKIACYIIDQATQRLKLAVIPATGGAPLAQFEKARAYTNEIGWSADSSALIYAVEDNEGGDLWSQPLNGGAPTRITDYQGDHIYRFAISPQGVACERGVTENDLVLIAD